MLGGREKRLLLFPYTPTLLTLPKHTGPSYKPYCMPSLTVALLLLEWLHDGVYAGRCWEVSVNVDVSIGKSTCTRRSYLTNIHINTTNQQQHPYHYFTVINIKKCSGSFHRAVMYH